MEAYLELSPSTDDLTALGIKSELVNPSVHDMQAEFNPMTSCTLQAENSDHAPSKFALNLKVFISFRSPTTPHPKISDQMPKGVLVIQNVNYNQVTSKKFLKFIYEKSRQMALNLHPCKDYNEVGLKYDLVQPRFGFWNPHGQRLLDVLDHGRAPRLPLRDMMLTSGAMALIVASMSFLIDLEPRPSSSEAASASKEDPPTPPSSSGCPPDFQAFKAWIDDLHNLAQMPPTFDTLSQYAQLAAEISRKLKPPPAATAAKALKVQLPVTAKSQRQRRRRGQRGRPGVKAPKSLPPRSVMARLGPKPPSASQQKAKQDDAALKRYMSH